MNHTEACERVLTHIAIEIRDLCQTQNVPTAQSVRLLEQVLSHPTVRTWAALQVMRLAPAA
jgi:hypothetical protein